MCIFSRHGHSQTHTHTITRHNRHTCTPVYTPIIAQFGLPLSMVLLLLLLSIVVNVWANLTFLHFDSQFFFALFLPIYQFSFVGFFEVVVVVVVVVVAPNGGFFFFSLLSHSYWNFVIDLCYRHCAKHFPTVRILCMRQPTTTITTTKTATN